MDLGLSGKVAVVAASSRGLGKASALALAREGAKVTICARTAAVLEAAADEIRREAHAEVLAVPADVTRAEDIQRVVGSTVERFGGVDVLVNNSGGPPWGSFPDLTDDDWRQAFEAVTLNFVRFVREVVPYMQEKRWGRIIGIQSTSVKQPVENLDLSNGTGRANGTEERCPRTATWQTSAFERRGQGLKSREIFPPFPSARPYPSLLDS